MMSDELMNAWASIDRTLCQQAPEVFECLAGPAKKSQIAALERKLRVRLPDDLKGSLRLHNGMRDSYLGSVRLVDNEALLPIDDLLKHWQMLKKLLAQGHFPDGGCPLTKTRKLKNDCWWNPAWIPITDNDGDGFYLDLDPPPKGKHGQVFYFHHDGARPRRVVADSYTVWLQRLAKKLASGKFSIEDGAIWIDD